MRINYCSMRLRKIVKHFPKFVRHWWGRKIKEQLYRECAEYRKSVGLKVY